MTRYRHNNIDKYQKPGSGWPLIDIDEVDYKIMALWDRIDSKG